MDWRLLLRSNRGVISGSALCAAGLSRHTLRTRVRNGSWQAVLPDVIVAHSGQLSAWERRKAAVLYAGEGAMLSHFSAGALFALGAEERVDVTIPHGRRRKDRAFVTVHQSARRCRPVSVDGLRCTPAARAVVDMACRLRKIDDVNALVSRAVQRRLVTVAELAAQAEKLPKHGSAHVRRVLSDLTAGTRSPGESAFLRLISSSGLRMPLFNAPVTTSAGTFYADALWEAERLIVEIDGAAWHLDALAWRRDLWRQNLLLNAGYRVLRFPVQRLRDDPAGVLAEIRTALRRAA